MKIRLLPLIFVIVFFYACGPSSAVLVVQGGKMKGCPSKTVKQMVDGFMESPVWESFLTDFGEVMVNIHGGIMSNDKPVNLQLQFQVKHEPLRHKGGTFKYYTLQLDDSPQNSLVALELLETMCGDGAKFSKGLFGMEFSDESMESIDYVDDDDNLQKEYDCQTLGCWIREKKLGLKKVFK
jgi:hypothetical protein